jgi:imidazoleglycerol-phosphate dehydratase
VKIERVGDLQTELVHDFFEGFAIGARANAREGADGRSSHHHVEAVFKAFARACVCGRQGQAPPRCLSTKGLV